MARRKKNPSDTTLYIALAAAGVALYYLMSPKAAAKPPVIGGDPFGPPNGGPPDGALPDGFMPTDKAMIIQKNLNILWRSDTLPPLVADGDFGAKSWAYYEEARTAPAGFAQRVEKAVAEKVPNLFFFANPNTFYDPIDSDKITFRLKGSSDSVTLRKSLYDGLSEAVWYIESGPYKGQLDTAFSLGDETFWFRGQR